MSRSVFRKSSEDPRRSCSECPEIKVFCWTDCYNTSGWTRTPQILMPLPLLRTAKERERDGGKKRRSSPGVGLPSSSHLSLLSRSGVNPLQSSVSTPTSTQWWPL
ncbi:uncharacterized protein LOC110512558 isoform X3 [Oncorhynchus mykiss]|uniref:uncharacterized protein LOC110512558 isoform X3 n=1 Tax=Oncorhynchus mykiss TaxID=8022 RepID=UPI001877582F|nr:uncharacterized protein LOC110512558 isoform X3 [Oncorhynchus mykiss]